MKPTVVSFWTKLLDFISPRPCVACGERLSIMEPMLCTSCLLRLRMIGCYKSPSDNMMAQMLKRQLPIEKAAALFFFQPHSSLANIVYSFKYHNRPDVAEEMGKEMARTMQPHGIFDDIDVLVPVPLTWWRKWNRGYNQSAMLAKGISELTGIPVDEKAVKRRRFAISQTQLKGEMRRENVKTAFKICRANRVEGKHVLIIDDVVTTGATTLACAKELLSVPGVKVSVASFGLTFSHALLPEEY